MTLESQWQPVTTPDRDLNLDDSGRDRPTERRIKIKIPKQYTGEPIVSRLASRYNLEFNINSALLGADRQNDGWFDLELRGKSTAIESALIYLQELDIEVWYDSRTNSDESDW